jgi:hypothetical protein
MALRKLRTYLGRFRRRPRWLAILLAKILSAFGPRKLPQNRLNSLFLTAD